MFDVLQGEVVPNSKRGLQFVVDDRKQIVMVNTYMYARGRFRIFIWGGGAKDYVRASPKSLMAGVQGPLKSPGSSRGGG